MNEKNCKKGVTIVQIPNECDGGNYLSTSCIQTPNSISYLDLSAGSNQTQINAALVSSLIYKDQQINYLEVGGTSIQAGENITIEGDGSEGNPYIINSTSDIDGFVDLTNNQSINGEKSFIEPVSGVNATQPEHLVPLSQMEAADADVLVAANAYADSIVSEENYTTADKTKVSYITITQAVNLDDIETRVNDLDAAVVLKGTWAASGGTFPGSGIAQAGWSYLVTSDGTVDGIEFKDGDRIIAVTDNASTTTYAGNWYKADYTDKVNTVAGRTGNVVITSSDLSDFNSAVNALITTAISGKQNTLVAGANITIDNTNTLAPVISASGGGTGFTGTLNILNQTPSISFINNNGSNGVITSDFVYYGKGNDFIKYSIDTGEEVLLTISGVSDWRCVFRHNSGNIFFSPMDSYSATIAASDHGLYKYNPVSDSVIKVLALTTRECIWGIDENSNGHIFAGVYSLAASNGKIYKSTDIGNTFTLVFTPTYSVATNHTHVVFVDKSNDNVYICGGDNYGGTLNYKSIDGGTTFNPILTGKTINQFTAGIAGVGYRLFGTDQSPYGRIYRTTDDIDYTLVLDTHYQNCFFFRRSDITGWIYAGFKLDPSATTNLYSEIYVSKDEGLTWKVFYTSSSDSSGNGFWFASEFFNGKMLVGFSDSDSFENLILIDEIGNNQYVKNNNIFSSRDFNEFDNNSILNIKNSVTLTIPKNLPSDFNCRIDPEGGSCFITPSVDVTLSSPNGNLVSANSDSYLYRSSLKEIFRLKSNKISNVSSLQSNQFFNAEMQANSNDNISSLTGVDTNITYVSGLLGNAASFNGSSSFVNYTDNSLFSFTDGVNDVPFSIEIWVNFSNNSVSQVLLNKQNNTNQREYIIAWNGTNLTCILIKQNDAATNIRANYLWTPTINTWYQLVFTYDGSKSQNGIKIYVNGSLVTTTNIINGGYAGMTNGTSSLGLGKNQLTNTEFFNGKMDNVRMWKYRVLTAEDISSFYNSGAGKTYPY